MERLTNDLPNYYSYHSVKHTIYVVEKTEYIARKEKVTEAEILLLKVAALYHDIGFLKSHLNHEINGVLIAKEELPLLGFSTTEIELICGMIMATKLPQSPKTKLECILADADLEYLATNKYKPVSDLLFKELKYFNENLSPKEWENIQINFLSSHHYFTNYCKRYKEFRKHKNLKKIIG